MARKKKKRRVEKRIEQTISKKTAENLQNIKENTAEKLRKAGYSTITKLAQAQPERLVQKTGLKKHLVEKLIFSARDVCKELSRKQSSKEKETIIKKPMIKGKLLQVAIKNEKFRRRIIHYVVKKLF